MTPGAPTEIADARGIANSDLIANLSRSSMGQLTAWTLGADKALKF